MERLTYWNNKEKGSALPVAINDNGDTVDLETLCAKLADYEDTGLEPSEILTGLELANVYAAMQELKRYKDAEEQAAVTWNTRTDPEKDRLQQENEQLRELVRLAVGDMKDMASTGEGLCDTCTLRARSCATPLRGFCNQWKWQHAGKLKELEAGL